jgi:hypothetical protein
MYVPNTEFEISPKTIDVSTSFHVLEATAKPEDKPISVRSVREPVGIRTPRRP